MRGLRTFCAILALCAFVAAPGLAAKKKTAKSNETLFHQLGGMKAINAVVEDFVGRAATDVRIKSFFAKTASSPKQLKHFKMSLAQQICQAAGGPCKYKGKDMKTAHAGMGITEGHFSALVEDLSATLKKFKVKSGAKEQLLGALTPMKADIVSSESDRAISSAPPATEETMAPAPEATPAPDAPAAE